METERSKEIADDLVESQVAVWRMRGDGCGGLEAKL